MYAYLHTYLPSLTSILTVIVQAQVRCGCARPGFYRWWWWWWRIPSVGGVISRKRSRQHVREEAGPSPSRSPPNSVPLFIHIIRSSQGYSSGMRYSLVPGLTRLRYLTEWAGIGRRDASWVWGRVCPSKFVGAVMASSSIRGGLLLCVLFLMSLLLVSPCTARLGWWDAGTSCEIESSTCPWSISVFSSPVPLSSLIVRKFEEGPPPPTALKLDRPWSQLWHRKKCVGFGVLDHGYDEDCVVLNHVFYEWCGGHLVKCDGYSANFWICQWCYGHLRALRCPFFFFFFFFLLFFCFWELI